jgi:predicted CoA-binding protein
MKVAVVGASNKSHKYSYQAVILLKEYGHKVYPVQKKVERIEGLDVFPSIKDITDNIDVVTMYVGRIVSEVIGDDIIKKKPKKIIFNPGTENLEMENKAKKAGIKTVHACTLLMLKTGQFK